MAMSVQEAADENALPIIGSASAVQTDTLL